MIVEFDEDCGGLYGCVKSYGLVDDLSVDNNGRTSVCRCAAHRR